MHKSINPQIMTKRRIINLIDPAIALKIMHFQKFY